MGKQSRRVRPLRNQGQFFQEDMKSGIEMLMETLKHLYPASNDPKKFQLGANRIKVIIRELKDEDLAYLRERIDSEIKTTACCKDTFVLISSRLFRGISKISIHTTPITVPLLALRFLGSRLHPALMLGSFLLMSYGCYQKKSKWQSSATHFLDTSKLNRLANNKITLQFMQRIVNDVFLERQSQASSSPRPQQTA